MKYVPSLLLVFMVACSAPRPQINSVSDAIVVTAADIETIAQQVWELCGNSVPRGACRDGAVISTATKNEFRNRLQEANDALRTANRALAADESFDASDNLGRATSLLTLLRAELARLEN